MSFRRNVFVSGHFEPVIEPQNADAPDTQLQCLAKVFIPLGVFPILLHYNL
jgi:hypothetical protein